VKAINGIDSAWAFFKRIGSTRQQGNLGKKRSKMKKAGAAAGLFAFACSRGDQYFATIGPPKV
jgi:hypothetical protein